MSLQVIGAYQARQNFGQIIEQAFYQGKSFLVKRGRRKMAYLVGQPFFEAFFKLLERDKGLADTLAILTNPEVEEIIKKGNQDIAKGKTYPLSKLLED